MLTQFGKAELEWRQCRGRIMLGNVS